MNNLQVEWPFSEPAAPDDPNSIENLPSPEGEELGRHIARWHDAEFAKSGRDSRCEDCAFRLGTNPNKSLATTMDVVKCLLEHTPFGCHLSLRVCGGYADLVRSESK